MTSEQQSRQSIQSQLQQTCGVQFHFLPPNCASAMQQWMGQHLMTTITSSHSTPLSPLSPPPVLVIFDRFYAEEMYSFHFQEYRRRMMTGNSNHLNLVMVLDMQDWHSLRTARQAYCLKQDETTIESQPFSSPHKNDDDDDDENNNNHNNHISSRKDMAPSPLPPPWLVAKTIRPTLNNHTNNNNNSQWLRELASIHRCDLTLVCSPWEANQLLRQHRYRISPTKLCTAPLLLVGQPGEDHRPGEDETVRSSPLPPPVPSNFENRHDCVWVGNFRHAPNVDAVQQLEDRLWPQLLLRHDWPSDACLHIYGAYAPPKWRRRQRQGGGGRTRNHRTRLLFHGYGSDLSSILLHSRLLLAPLRYGAGLKGKIVQAWNHGLPVVTTSIGSEGLVEESEDDDDDESSLSLSSSFAGIVADQEQDFVQGVVHLYTNPVAWKQAQDKIPPLLSRLAAFDQNVLPTLSQAVWSRQEQLQQPQQGGPLSEEEEEVEEDAVQALLWHSSMERTKYFSKYIECRQQLRQLQQQQQQQQQQPQQQQPAEHTVRETGKPGE
ncbi:hypothetical protein ACA910_002524 [Epithemia clementina (nom. ined.)]